MIEPEEIARFRRHVRAMGKAACDDPAAFAAMVQLYDEFQVELRASTSILNHQGFSWSDIADALGIKTQSAWERWRVRQP